jgi:hypothetical protein
MIWAFLVPRLAALWSRTWFYLSIVGAVAVAIGIAFIKGRADGKATYARQREAAKIKAHKQAEKIRDAIQNAGGDRIDRDLDKWMRD